MSVLVCGSRESSAMPEYEQARMNQTEIISIMKFKKYLKEFVCL